MTMHYLKPFVCLLATLVLSSAPAQQSFNNDSVIKMFKMGFQEEMIVGQINRSPGTYDTSPAGLTALKNAGVGDKAVAAMVNKTTSPAPPAPPTQTMPISKVAPPETQANSHAAVSTSDNPARQAESSQQNLDRTVPSAYTPKPPRVYVTDDPIDAQSGLSATKIFQNAKSSVVTVVGSDREAKLTIQGSGFVVAENRIVTNHHVAAGMATAVAVFPDGTTSTISAVASDNPAADLVVLVAETHTAIPLKLGDESSLQQGDPVYAIGAPKGLELSLTSGIVSSFRNIDGQFFIQTTASIWHGSSGGPLFDREGRVVGITSAFYHDAPGIYLSVSVGDLTRLLRTPQNQIVSLPEWSRHLSPEANSTQSSGTSRAGWETGSLSSWKAAKDEERTFFISSDDYVYGVTHALGARAIYWAAAIGARNPLSNLPLGSKVQFRVQGRYMYILLNKKETMYSIDTANPRR